MSTTSQQSGEARVQPPAGPSHVVVVRPWGAVCLTCGRVSTVPEALDHAQDTFLRSERRAS